MIINNNKLNHIGEHNQACQYVMPKCHRSECTDVMLTNGSRNVRRSSALSSSIYGLAQFASQL